MAAVSGVIHRAGQAQPGSEGPASQQQHYKAAAQTIAMRAATSASEDSKQCPGRTTSTSPTTGMHTHTRAYLEAFHHSCCHRTNIVGPLSDHHSCCHRTHKQTKHDHACSLPPPTHPPTPHASPPPPALPQPLPITCLDHLSRKLMATSTAVGPSTRAWMSCHGSRGQGVFLFTPAQHTAYVSHVMGCDSDGRRVRTWYGCICRLACLACCLKRLCVAKQTVENALCWPLYLQCSPGRGRAHVAPRGVWWQTVGGRVYRISPLSGPGHPQRQAGACWQDLAPDSHPLTQA
jgi:hypothetical protein